MERSRVEIRENTRKLLEMRRADPQGLSVLVAQKCVQRGKRWLKRHAPVGWHRNLFEPQQDGKSWFRAKNSHGNECVLALAFESREDLANEDGYVTFASVSNHFELGFRDWKHGFDARGESSRYPGFHVSTELLDKEWERAMRAFGDYAYSAHKHPWRSTRKTA